MYIFLQLNYEDYMYMNSPTKYPHKTYDIFYTSITTHHLFQPNLVTHLDAVDKFAEVFLVLILLISAEFHIYKKESKEVIKYRYT